MEKGKEFQIQGIARIVLILFFLSAETIINSDPGNTTIPSPGENMLIIYTSEAGNALSVTSVIDALSATYLGANAPTITTIVVPANNTNGIYPYIPGADLAAKQAYLNGFCEVWDMRFKSDVTLCRQEQLRAQP